MSESSETSATTSTEICCSTVGQLREAIADLPDDLRCYDGWDEKPLVVGLETEQLYPDSNITRKYLFFSGHKHGYEGECSLETDPDS